MALKWHFKKPSIDYYREASGEDSGESGPGTAAGPRPAPNSAPMSGFRAAAAGLLVSRFRDV